MTLGQSLGDASPYVFSGILVVLFAGLLSLHRFLVHAITRTPAPPSSTAIIGVLFVIIGCVAVSCSETERHRQDTLLADCLSDGHKQYECESILYRGHRP